MCGVVGYYGSKDRNDKSDLEACRRLVYESRVRGLHSFGLAWLDDQTIGVKKFKKLSKEGLYSYLRSAICPKDTSKQSQPRRCVIHNRYSTSGDWHNEDNNQPIVVGRTAVAANCVISMKTREEFNEEFQVDCQSDNDTEIFLRVMSSGVDSSQFIRSIRGSFAGVYLRNGEIFALRNLRRPLYYSANKHSCLIYSTEDIALRSKLTELRLSPPKPVPPYTELCLKELLT